MFRGTRACSPVLSGMRNCLQVFRGVSGDFWARGPMRQYYLVFLRGTLGLVLRNTSACLQDFCMSESSQVLRICAYLLTPVYLSHLWTFPCTPKKKKKKKEKKEKKKKKKTGEHECVPQKTGEHARVLLDLKTPAITRPYPQNTCK